MAFFSFKEAQSEQKPEKPKGFLKNVADDVNRIADNVMGDFSFGKVSEGDKKGRLKKVFTGAKEKIKSNINDNFFTSGNAATIPASEEKAQTGSKFLGKLAKSVVQGTVGGLQYLGKSAVKPVLGEDQFQKIYNSPEAIARDEKIFGYHPTSLQEFTKGAGEYATSKGATPLEKLGFQGFAAIGSLFAESPGNIGKNPAKKFIKGKVMDAAENAAEQAAKKEVKQLGEGVVDTEFVENAAKAPIEKVDTSLQAAAKDYDSAEEFVSAAQFGKVKDAPLINQKEKLTDIWNKAVGKKDPLIESQSSIIGTSRSEKRSLDKSASYTLRQSSYEPLDKETNDKLVAKIFEKKTSPTTPKMESSIVEIPDSLKEREMRLNFERQALNEDPARNLVKYFNYRKGEMPEVTGTGKSIFGRKGDDIVTKYGYEDSEKAREAVRAFVDRRKAYQEDLRNFKKEKSAAAIRESRIAENAIVKEGEKINTAIKEEAKKVDTSLQAAAKKYNKYEDFEMAVKRGNGKELPFYTKDEMSEVLNPKYEDVIARVKKDGYRDLKDFYFKNKAPRQSFFPPRKSKAPDALVRKESARKKPLLRKVKDQKKNQPSISNLPPADRTEKSIREILAKDKRKVSESYEDIVLDDDGKVKSSSKIAIDDTGSIIPTPARGGITPPKLDLKAFKDKGTFRLNRETLERNIDGVAGKEDAKKLKEFIVDPIRKNETERIEFVNKKRRAIKDLYNKLDIKIGSKEDRFVQLLGEGATTLDQVMRELPAGSVDKVNKAIDYFRGEYDTLLDKVNTVRENFNYTPIPKRKDYFRHFREMNDIIGQFGLIFRGQDLPTEIAGVTDIFKPGKPFSTAELKRMGTATDISAAKGMDNYLESISKQTFHIDSVQRARSLERYIRDTAKYASENAKDAGDFLVLPNFVANISEYGNRLAGKKTRFDRAFESLIGRQVFGVADWLRKQTGANMIGGNISSAITNFIPLTQSLATTDKRFVLQGLMDGMAGPFLKDPTNIAGQKSSFLTRRFPENQILSDLRIPTNKAEVWEVAKAMTFKSARVAGKLFDSVDRMTARSIVGGKYYENLKKGMAPADAMKAADEYAGKVIGDRSFGNTPNLFDNKSIGFLTQFQLEVNNLYSFLKKDIPEMSDGNRWKIASALAQVALFSYAFNEVYEKVNGRRPTLDPLNGALTIAGLNDDGEGLSIGKRTMKAGKDILENLPYSSLIMQGGRVPVASVVPALGKVVRGESTLKDELKKPLFGLVLPFGGMQIKKTTEGIKAYREGEVNTKTGKMAYEVKQTVANAIKMGIFGKAAAQEAVDYYQMQDRVYSIVDAKDRVSKKQAREAEQMYLNLKAVAEGEGGKEEANAMYQQLEAEDPEFAKLVYEIGTDAKLDGTDRAIKQMGVEDGTRARYIYLETLKKETKEEKNAYVQDLMDKGLMSDTVYDQVAEMVQQKQPEFHEKEQMTDDGVIDTVFLYAKAIGVDPLTAFNRIFTGQRIRRIDNRAIIVERLPFEESTRIRGEQGADATVKLDHTIPLQLGGSNTKGNLKLVPTASWESYTPVENYLGKLLRDGNIKKKEAQRLIAAFKAGEISFDEIKSQTNQ